MAAATQKTTMAPMMIAEQEKMMNVRRDIEKMLPKILKRYEGYVKEQLGVITQEAQVILQEGQETTEGSENFAQAIEGGKKKLEEKIQEMEAIKKNLEAYLNNQQLDKLPSSYLQSRGSASKEKGEAAGEDELESKLPVMDTVLEKILQDAAIKSKEEEFNRLREQLKLCLLCFSIFPIDAEIEKRVLIYWWIGEGFVTAKPEKTAEEVGKDCFKELVDLDFIQPVYNRKCGNIVRCRMHPWIRWMIIVRSRKEEFFNLDESGTPSLSPFKSQHACIMSKNQDGHHNFDEYCPKPDGPNLLTLFNLNVRYLRLNFGGESLPKFKTLVVLQLGSWQCSNLDHDMDIEEPITKHDPGHHIEIIKPEILDKICALVRLRYLSLRSISMITKLPNSIGALQNLKILDLRECYNLEKITDEIKWLKKLTHLDVSHCPLLEDLPKELGSLSELEVLKGFVFGSYRSHDPCKLADLARLKKLWKLSISIWSGVDSDNVDLQDLNKIKGLRSLTITWSIASFTNLRLPFGLVKLDLRGFPESNLPPWFNPKGLPNLEKLYIREGKLAKLDLQGDWKIKMLCLKFLRELNLKPDDIGEFLEKLDYLQIYKCPKIEVSHQMDRDGMWVNEKPSAPAMVPSASTPAPTTTSYYFQCFRREPCTNVF